MSYFLSWQKSNTLISDKKKNAIADICGKIYASNQNKDGQYLFLLFSTWINIFLKK